MRKILVLGGNQYFGKKLVQLLIDSGDDVTILNRGNKDDGFGDKVNRIKCDRHNRNALKKAIVEDYDVVFDQSCFDYDQAKIACDVFNGKVRKYIFTSSISAYNTYGRAIKESIFDPLNFSFEKKETMDSNYGEAKRQAEVSFYRYANFPVTAVRLPIVLDDRDATERLQFHVNKIKNKQPIHITNIESKIAFISADDAAKALNELSLSDFVGPINVASPDPISLKQCVEWIEDIVGQKRVISKERSEDNESPYNITQDWFVDCSKLENLGIKLEPIEDYLPRMIKSINEQGDKISLD